jgi:hypothetical protein
LEEIVAHLEALEASSFGDANTGSNAQESLDRLCDELRTTNGADASAPALFGIMERLDGAGWEATGLVHRLELWRGVYERRLADSVRKKPTPPSVWMINRILNAHPPDAEDWLTLLKNGADHPAASLTTKATALDFLKYQKRRSVAHLKTSE